MCLCPFVDSVSALGVVELRLLLAALYMIHTCYGLTDGVLSVSLCDGGIRIL